MGKYFNKKEYLEVRKRKAFEDKIFKMILYIRDDITLKEMQSLKSHYGIKLLQQLRGEVNNLIKLIKKSNRIESDMLKWNKHEN